MLFMRRSRKHFCLFGYEMGWFPEPKVACIIEQGICLYAPCFNQ